MVVPTKTPMGSLLNGYAKKFPKSCPPWTAMFLLEKTQSNDCLFDMHVLNWLWLNGQL